MSNTEEENNEELITTEDEIVDNYFTDTLYTHPFKNEKGKYFTVVSKDREGAIVIDAEHTYPFRNKIKTTLTFIKNHNDITDISFKRFKYYKHKKWVEQEEQITFSYPFFKKLIGFLQSLSKLNLNDINERRIGIADSPKFDEETIKNFNTISLRPEGQELIKQFIKNGHVTSTDIVNIGYRKTQLEIFSKLLNEKDYILEYIKLNNIKSENLEAVWQHFFETNDWIFGYGLNFIFNEPLEGKKLEQIVQGSDVSKSGKRTDGLLKTNGILSSLCLVEIKTPDTLLLKPVTNPYRVDCWQTSDELNGGIIQAQKTAHKTVHNITISPELRLYDDKGNPTGEVIFSYQPKSYLIVGNLLEFKTEKGVNKEKFSSFELLRKNIISPEIITFDELYERAKFIVLQSQKNIK